MSFPIAAHQCAELYWTKKPDHVSIDRFYYAIGDIVANAPATRSIDRNGASNHVTYNSIAGDVINDNELNGLADNNMPECESVVDPASTTLEQISLIDDIDSSNAPNER